MGLPASLIDRMQECCRNASGESRISLRNQHWQITEAVMIHSSNCICYLGDGVNDWGPHRQVRVSCSWVTAKLKPRHSLNRGRSRNRVLDNSWPILTAGHSTLLLGLKPHVSCQKRQPSTDVVRTRDTRSILRPSFGY